MAASTPIRPRMALWGWLRRIGRANLVGSSAHQGTLAGAETSSWVDEFQAGRRDAPTENAISPSMRSSESTPGIVNVARTSKAPSCERVPLRSAAFTAFDLSLSVIPKCLRNPRSSRLKTSSSIVRLAALGSETGRAVRSASEYEVRRRFGLFPQCGLAITGYFSVNRRCARQAWRRLR